MVRPALPLPAMYRSRQGRSLSLLARSRTLARNQDRSEPLYRPVARRAKATLSSPELEAEAPTRQQLWRCFVASAVPMFGFGFMDQTIMLQVSWYLSRTRVCKKPRILIVESF